jgi:hypothetical protein
MKGRLVALIPEDMSPTSRTDIIPSDPVGDADAVSEVEEEDTSAGVVIGGPGGVTALAEGVGVT